MTATTTERLTEGAKLSRGTYPIAANMLILKGTIVCLNSDGRAIAGNTVSGGAVVCVGKASHTLDNRTGSALGGGAGAADIEVEFGVFGWLSGADADAVTIADVGSPVFVMDNQTVAGVDTGRIPAGVCTEVRNGFVYVDMSPTVFAALTQPEGT
jgi:hypothetical protein